MSGIVVVPLPPACGGGGEFPGIAVALLVVAVATALPGATVWLLSRRDARARAYRAVPIDAGLRARALAAMGKLTRAEADDVITYYVEIGTGRRPAPPEDAS